MTDDQPAEDPVAEEVGGPDADRPARPWPGPSPDEAWWRGGVEEPPASRPERPRPVPPPRRPVDHTPEQVTGADRDGGPDRDPGRRRPRRRPTSRAIEPTVRPELRRNGAAHRPPAPVPAAEAARSGSQARPEREQQLDRETKPEQETQPEQETKPEQETEPEQPVAVPPPDRPTPAPPPESGPARAVDRAAATGVPSRRRPSPRPPATNQPGRAEHDRSATEPVPPGGNPGELREDGDTPRGEPVDAPFHPRRQLVAAASSVQTEPVRTQPSAVPPGGADAPDTPLDGNEQAANEPVDIRPADIRPADMGPAGMGPAGGEPAKQPGPPVALRAGGQPPAVRVRAGPAPAPASPRRPGTAAAPRSPGRLASAPAQARSRARSARRRSYPTRQRGPRPPVLGLAALLLLAPLSGFFAWVTVEPLWLALGHGSRGTATVTECAGHDLTLRCAGTFTAAGNAFSAPSVTVAALPRDARHAGARVPARMVSARGRAAYAGAAGQLHARWLAGLSLVLLCGLAIGWSTGASRLRGRRARVGAYLGSACGPLLLLVGMLTIAW